METEAEHGADMKELEAMLIVLILLALCAALVTG